MAVITQIADSSGLALGKFLQIRFIDGIINQISEDFSDWENVQRRRSGDADGREQRFLLQTSLGPAAIQYLKPSASGSSGGAFPSAQQVSIGEKTAYYKELAATVELEYHLWDRARRSPAKYAEPLLIEIDSKIIALKRRLSADLYGDGTGVLGTVSSAADGGSYLTVTLDTGDTERGFVGWFEYDDEVLITANSGSTVVACGVASGTVAYYKVVGKSRADNTVDLQPYDSSDNELTCDGAGSVAATNVIRRRYQPTMPDVSGTITDDYGGVSEVMAGLESLAANDGRSVHDITMSGATAGSRYSAGAALDVAHIQAALSECKVAVGPSYRWDTMTMAPETHSKLIESRETDRRFVSVTDNKRGTSGFAYVHGQDTLKVVESEFCPAKRIYMLPTSKADGSKVLEFWGKDFEVVKPGGAGSEFFLKPNSAGYDRMITSFMQGYVCLLSRRPSAICVVHNFT